MKKHSEKWFINRIGCVVYRESVFSKNTFRTITIYDKQHAKYLYSVHESHGLSYQDKPIKIKAK
jgi:hypothetical protein